MLIHPLFLLTHFHFLATGILYPSLWPCRPCSFSFLCCPHFDFWKRMHNPRPINHENVGKPHSNDACSLPGSEVTGLALGFQGGRIFPKILSQKIILCILLNFCILKLYEGVQDQRNSLWLILFGNRYMVIWQITFKCCACFILVSNINF